MGGVEVHARSVFLQGLLLMPSALIPAKFAPYLTQLKRWQVWLEGEAAGKSPVQACLAHVASYTGIDRIVVGADSLGQLQAIIEATSTLPLQAPESLASNLSALINPAKWNNL